MAMSDSVNADIGKKRQDALSAALDAMKKQMEEDDIQPNRVFAVAAAIKSLTERSPE
jgi:hypothetical protein